jgi:hypothetical protein
MTIHEQPSPVTPVASSEEVASARQLIAWFLEHNCPAKDVSGLILAAREAGILSSPVILGHFEAIDQRLG